MITILSKIPTDLWGASAYIFSKYAPLFYFGAKNTLIIALSGTIIGLIIGLGIGILRALPVYDYDSRLKHIVVKLIRFITSIYVEVFRGTPMMVQAVFIYNVFLFLFKDAKLLAGIVIVSVNTGAYMAEIIRAGIQSLDKGQNEAARSIGMNNFQTMLFIILPQAIRNAFPAIGNEFVVNIKDTSVLNVIGVTELFFQSTTVAGIIYRFSDTFFVTAIIYLFLTYSTTLILKFIEHKMNMSGFDGPHSQTTPLIKAHYIEKEKAL